MSIVTTWVICGLVFTHKKKTALSPDSTVPFSDHLVVALVEDAISSKWPITGIIFTVSMFSFFWLLRVSTQVDENPAILARVVHLVALTAMIMNCIHFWPLLRAVGQRSFLYP